MNRLNVQDTHQTTRSIKEQNPVLLIESLNRCAQGDETALFTLYKACSVKLFGIALRMLKNEHWAEEALQEAFIKIWNHANSYQPGKGSAMTWMINIVRNQSLDILRKPQYRQEFERREPESDEPAHLQGPLTYVEQNHNITRLLNCLQELREDQRHCILLKYYQGYTPTEISRREQLPLGTVKTWLRRGLMTIRERMDSYDPQTVI